MQEKMQKIISKRLQEVIGDHFVEVYDGGVENRLEVRVEVGTSPEYFLVVGFDYETGKLHTEDLMISVLNGEGLNDISKEKAKELWNRVDDLLVYTDDSRYCDTCGKEMREGYLIAGGEEYYCSDECLPYSRGEWLAIYAGLDNTDPKEVERAKTLSHDELNHLSDVNDSQSYYTTWED